MKALHLEGVHFRDEDLQALAKSSIQKIKYLSLANSTLSDDSFMLLKDWKVKIGDIYLKNNLLKDTSARMIADKWASHLTGIELNENLITSLGIDVLLGKITDRLRFLHLNGMLSLPESSLAKKMPPSIISLDIANNFVSSEKLTSIMMSLPKTLKVLDISGALLSENDAQQFASSLPPFLQILSMKSMTLANQSWADIYMHLPESIHNVHISFDFHQTEVFERLTSRDYPRLRSVYMSNISQLSAKQLSKLKGFFPDTTDSFSLANIKIDHEKFSALNQLTPPNLSIFTAKGWDCSAIEKDMKSFIFPQSIEYLDTQRGSGCGAEFMRGLSQRKYDQLYVFALNDASINSELWKSFQKHPKPIRTALFIEKSGAWDLNFVNDIPKELFYEKNFVGFSKTKLGHKAAEKLLQKLSPETVLLWISNIGLTYDNLDSVIAALPKNLYELDIAGNDIGQAGLEKFRAFKKRGEKESGIPFRLLE